MLEKLSRIRDPQYYLAESVSDFKESRQMIRSPVWQRGRFQLGHRAFVGIYNVRIEFIPEAEMPWYLIADASGGVLAYWDPQHPYHPSPQAPEDVLRPGESSAWVHCVVLYHLVDQDHTVFGPVERDPPSPSKEGRSSERGVFEDFADLVLQPGY